MAAKNQLSNSRLARTTPIGTSYLAAFARASRSGPKMHGGSSSASTKIRIARGGVNLRAASSTARFSSCGFDDLVPRYSYWRENIQLDIRPQNLLNAPDQDGHGLSLTVTFDDTTQVESHCQPWNSGSSSSSSSAKLAGVGCGFSWSSFSSSPAVYKRSRIADTLASSTEPIVVFPARVNCQAGSQPPTRGRPTTPGCGLSPRLEYSAMLHGAHFIKALVAAGCRVASGSSIPPTGLVPRAAFRNTEIGTPARQRRATCHLTCFAQKNSTGSCHRRQSA